MGKKFSNFKTKLKEKEKQLFFELKRKAAHSFSLLALLFLVLFEEKLAIKIIGILLILILIGNWYFTRKWRVKAYQTIYAEIGLPEHLAKEKAREFEKTIINFLKNFLRKEEEQPFQASFKAILSIFLALSFFGSTIATFGILALCFGDTVAALIGKKFGKVRLFKSKKTLEGAVGFFISTFISTIVFLIFFPTFAFTNVLIIATFTALIGTLAEIIPEIDDNIIIPFAVALAIWILYLCF
ncbi:MAG: hypothetical protein QXQ79_01650 [Candidatus Nanoarchaeia archaeon]